MNIKSLIFLTIVLLFVETGCKKFVTIDSSKTELASGTIFSDSSTAEAAMQGLYSRYVQTVQLLISSGYNIYTELAADNLSYTGTVSSSLQFENNSISSTNSINSTNLWRYGYVYIYQVNACIEGLKSTTSLSVSQRNRLLGEAEFNRAFIYFYMQSLYGRVPLELTTNYEINATLARTSNDSINLQIIQDLKNAKELMSVDYFNSERTRPNKFAASVLLARVYLCLNQYALALNEIDTVINSGLYSLNTIENVFMSTSNETIFQLYPSQALTTFNSEDGYLFNPSSSTAKPTYKVTNSLLNSFESNDLRLSNWLKKTTVNSVSYTYPYKYKTRLSSSITEYNIVFRLAECYLIRLESNYYLGNYSETLKDLNLIRNRAGLEDFTSTSSSELKTEIINENRWEYFAECGHRWIDLKRWGIMDAVLKANKTTYESTDSLFPIPNADILRNPNLTQNAGY